MNMLLMGTANPAGERSTYNGLYFRQDELAAMVAGNELHGVHVKAEHTGSTIGRVVSAFLSTDGALQCVLQLDDSVEGAIAGGLVRDGIAADLSMGYAVDVQHSETSTGRRLVAGKKKTLEVSLVRKGARKGCHISAYHAASDRKTYRHNGHEPHADTWAVFDLQ